MATTFLAVTRPRAVRIGIRSLLRFSGSSFRIKAENASSMFVSFSNPLNRDKVQSHREQDNLSRKSYRNTPTGKFQSFARGLCCKITVKRRCMPSRPIRSKLVYLSCFTDVMYARSIFSISQGYNRRNPRGNVLTKNIFSNEVDIG